MKETTEESSNMSEADFMHTFLTSHKPPQEAIEYFHSVPWLNSYFSNPVYKPIPTFSRHPKANGEDYFFSRTINTSITVPHMVTLQLADFKTPEATTSNAHPQDTPSQSGSHITTIIPKYPDAVTMISIGARGIDGHPGLIHGGVTCALFDETMGLLVMLHDSNICGPGARHTLFTANLNVSFRAPITTPGDYLIKMWLVKRQGRKWYTKGVFTDKDDKVYAQGDGLWIVAAGSKI